MKEQIEARIEVLTDVLRLLSNADSELARLGDSWFAVSDKLADVLRAVSIERSMLRDKLTLNELLDAEPPLEGRV